MATYELNDKEFRKILLKEFSELQESRELNKIGKTIHE